MIVSILPSSSNYHAIGYNEHKVTIGSAILLETKNINLKEGTERNPAAIIRYMQEYSARNTRAKKTQFHVAFSCKGKALTEQQLLDFAHLWLKEMGYDDPEQPLLVYAHRDTNNNHIHIVTSRINPQGMKIDHNHERRRSQKAIDKILNMNRREKVLEDIEKIKTYTFSTMGQFKALLRAMGYESYIKDGELLAKFGGEVKEKIAVSEIEKYFRSNVRDKKRCQQLRQQILKYKGMAGNIDELRTDLKKKFGFDIIIYGKEQSPVGYFIVDHHTRAVINGARVLSLKNLLNFKTPDERAKERDALIDRLFTSNPKITTWELNETLRRNHCYVSRGVLYADGAKIPLLPHMSSALLRNDRIARIEEFQPTTEKERDKLCSIYKVSDASMVEISNEKNQFHDNSVAILRNLFQEHTGSELRDELRNAGFRISNDEDGDTFAIDFQQHIIINLFQEGIDADRLKDLKASNSRNNMSAKPESKTRGIVSSKGNQNRSDDVRGHKRDWEINSNGFDEPENEYSLKR